MFSKHRRFGDRRDDDSLVVVVRSPHRGVDPASPAAGQPRRGRGRPGVLPAAAKLLYHVALPAQPHLHVLPARAAAGRPADRRNGKITRIVKWKVKGESGRQNCTPK